MEKKIPEKLVVTTLSFLLFMVIILRFCLLRSLEECYESKPLIKDPCVYLDTCTINYMYGYYELKPRGKNFS